MPTPVHILETARKRTFIKDRRPDSELGPDDFAVLTETETGGVFAISYQGESAWERHPNGDELVQVMAGETTLTLLTETGPVAHTMGEGMMIVVPRGIWHKFVTPESVTVMTMTPQPTDHSIDQPEV